MNNNKMNMSHELLISNNSSNNKKGSIPSDKQVAANRKNAKLSTGPRSKKGKEISSGNSWKHGVSQQVFSMGTTNPEELSSYNLIYEGLVRAWDPQEMDEVLCIKNIAQGHIKLQRLHRYESEMIQRELEQYLPSTGDELVDSVKQAERVIFTLKNFDHDPTASVDCAIGLADTSSREMSIVAQKVAEKFGDLSSVTDQELGALRAGIFKLADHISEIVEKKRKSKEKLNHLIFINSIPNEKEIAKITKYGGSIERSIFQNYKLLIALQKIRKGGSGEMLKA
ncbi:MAG: hypothetical protein HN472_13980 [Nitrospina sp.]|jgi:hypothetical protein|nr:hypothetical protein [Nitrospina sp.]MBT3874431.1 hypothetical protein [Nitrospina sp.]MBT4047639.1 hypothetical protein [Nitrospina sp.]MBT4556999.1 hypothetical protein [Nitrospina sp.]MBT5347490.1 hypothetical protein [Nitrospina sp.]